MQQENSKKYFTQETIWHVDPTGLHFPSILAILHRSGNTQHDHHYLRKHIRKKLHISSRHNNNFQLKCYVIKKKTLTLLINNCN